MRDKIYGTLGFFPEVAAHLTVDYSKNYLEICTDLFLYLVTSTHNLRVWIGLAGIARDPSWPSWVPDWCSDPGEPHYLAHMENDYGDSSATRDTILEFRRPCSDVFAVAGLRICHITHTMDFLPLCVEKRKCVVRDLLQDASIDVSQDHPNGRSYEEQIPEIQDSISSIYPQQVFLTEKATWGTGTAPCGLEILFMLCMAATSFSSSENLNGRMEGKPSTMRSLDQLVCTGI